MKLLPIVLGMALALPQASYGQPVAPPPVAPEPPAVSASASTTQLFLNAGPLYVLTSTPSSRRNAFGLSLGVNITHEVTERLGFGFDFNLGLTDWDRAKSSVDFGNDAFSWTTGAYGSVTHWVTGAPKDQQFFRGMGALFAYVALSLGFVVGASAYIAAPFVAINQSDLAFTFDYFPTGSPRLFLEGGLGGLFYGHPEGGAVLGMETVAAVGLAFSRIQLRVRAAWSPPALQTGAPEPTQFFSLGATVGFSP